jgi:uncharacterized phage protein (TIGR01671 family)
MEYKFKFVLENKEGRKIVTQTYTLEDIMEYDMLDRIHEDLDEKYSCDGNCTNESTSFCECGGSFDSYSIIKKLMWTGLTDMDAIDIYENDIIKLTYGIPPISDRLVIEYAQNEYVHDISVSGWWMRNLRKNGCSSSLCSIYQGDIRILGNATDNPDLLKDTP